MSLKNTIKLSFLPFLSELYSSDRIDHVTKTEKEAIVVTPSSETGWDRVKKMFQTDEFGNVTPEANSILQTGCLSMFIGTLLGGSIYGKKAYENFMLNNEATKFATHLEAKGKLQDAVTLGMGKGAWRWGWRITLFSCTFVGMSTIIQVYRNKYGIMEYVASGALTGSLYRFNLGPRGWIVGGTVGSVLGLVCGGVTLGLLSLSGITMEEARYWQYKWKDSRQEYLRKGRAEYLAKEDFAVIKMHDEEVGKTGESLDNLDKDSRPKDVK